jgi:hypothetical protein
LTAEFVVEGASDGKVSAGIGTDVRDSQNGLAVGTLEVVRKVQVQDSAGLDPTAKHDAGPALRKVHNRLPGLRTSGAGQDSTGRVQPRKKALESPPLGPGRNGRHNLRVLWNSHKKLMHSVE